MMPTKSMNKLPCDFVFNPLDPGPTRNRVLCLGTSPELMTKA